MSDSDRAAFEADEANRSRERVMDPFIIAISGKSGCGNSTVSAKVANALGFTLINYTFKNMAADLGMTFQELLERSRVDPSYDRKLDLRQAELARKGNSVVGSRLAIWKLPEASLKVYLDASDITRAKRIIAREGGALAEVLEATRKRDSGDRGRYIDLYGIDNDDYSIADLIINTERFDADMEAKIICEAVAILRKSLA